MRLDTDDLRGLRGEAGEVEAGAAADVEDGRAGPRPDRLHLASMMPSGSTALFSIS